MKKLSILFTCVGRRVELLQEFRKAAESLNTDLRIIGSDITDTAPAMYFCDKQKVVCRISNSNYIQNLADICYEEKIDAIIPTIDTDLLILSQNKSFFEKLGAKVFVSDPDKIKICRDKRDTAKFFLSLGLNTPLPKDDWKKYRGGYPAFIKPKDGSSSINAYKVNDEKELETYAKEVSDYIVAPFIKGTEYTVDAFCDFNGNPIFITPRVRLAVRSGEVLKTRIEQDEQIIAETQLILKAFKPCGAITIQLIREEKIGKDYFIEINPRFGGGAPLSMKAGADSAKAVLNLLQGKRLEYENKVAKNGAIYSRFDQSICVNEDG